MRYDHERIADLLETQGRSQVWLANITGYNRSYVSTLLNGSRPITDEFAQLAARYLGVPVSWLISREHVTEAVAA